MIRLLVLIVVAYLAYRYYGWYAAGGIIVAYFLLTWILASVNAGRSRQKADTLIHQKLSDAERTHLGAVGEHERAMDAHKAQFDPDLRKKMGPQ
jgi:hypothetical protein